MLYNVSIGLGFVRYWGHNMYQNNWIYSKLLDFLFPRTIRTTSKIAKMLGVLPSWIFLGIISMWAGLTWARGHLQHFGVLAQGVGSDAWSIRRIAGGCESAQRSRKGGWIEMVSMFVQNIQWCISRILVNFMVEESVFRCTQKMRNFLLLCLGLLIFRPHPSAF